jgi:hypothetical protein
MKIGTKKRLMAGALVQALAVGSWLVGSQLPAGAGPWSTGDVFVATSQGQYKVFTSSGTPLETLGALTPAPGYTAGCAFNPAGFPPAAENLYTLLWSENKVNILSPVHPHAAIATIDTTNGGVYSGHPESIVFNSSGEFYIGLVDGAGPNLLKYAAAATTGSAPIATYTLGTGSRGVDATSLSADQNTIYYTSEDATIRRFDLLNNVQLTPFTTNVTMGTTYGVRVLQGGNPFGGAAGTGFLMVADYSFNAGGDTGVIRVFNSAGTQLTTYDTPTDGGWFSLSIKSGGAQFVAGDFRTGNMVTFSADHTFTSFNAVPNQPFRANGVCVRGEVTPGVVPFPSTGFFIVGDVSAGYAANGTGTPVLGTKVYFWGNLFETKNTFSGGNNSNTASFKGFAEVTTPATPFCNPPGPASAFISGGGASSSPPVTLTNEVAIIITSAMGKSGSIKAQGAVKAIVVVTVDQGTYNNSSGGVGTGTINRIVCAT